MSQLREFTMFPELPLEIQWKIWKRAMRMPRVVGIQKYIFEQGRDEKTGDLFLDIQFATTARRWTILHICKKVRKEGLRFLKEFHDYTIRCTYRMNGPTTYVANFAHIPAQPIYTVPGVDTLWLVDLESPEEIYDPIATLVNYLATKKTDRCGRPCVYAKGQFKTIAIGYEWWCFNTVIDHSSFREEYETEIHKYLMDNFQRLEVKEILLVVSDKRLSTAKNITFIPPSNTAANLLSGQAMMNCDELDNGDGSWQAREDAIIAHLRGIRDDLVTQRQRIIEHAFFNPTGPDTISRMQGTPLEYCEDWRLNSIRIVEAEVSD